MKYGKLTPISRVYEGKFYRLLCLCDCGGETVVHIKYLKSGKITSCERCSSNEETTTKDKD